MPLENFENRENLKIQIEKHENHENHRIPYEKKRKL